MKECNADAILNFVDASSSNPDLLADDVKSQFETLSRDVEESGSCIVTNSSKLKCVVV